MMSAADDTLQEFVEGLRASALSSFYREKWGEAKELSALPTTSRADLIETPLSYRRYSNEPSLIKIVHTPHGPFLSEWGFGAIRQERYGLASKRPMVYLADPHDALEKALWCYEQGMVPALGEKNPAVAESIAQKYRIDSLICDVPSLRALEPHLRSRTAKLQSISILGTTFPLEELKAFVPYAEQVRLVLALSEAGACAEAVFEQQPIFKVHPNCFIEEGSMLLLTKVSALATPLVRYDTDIAIQGVKKEGGRWAELALI